MLPVERQSDVTCSPTQPFYRCLFRRRGEKKWKRPEEEEGRGGRRDEGLGVPRRKGGQGYFKSMRKSVNPEEAFREQGGGVKKQGGMKDLLCGRQPQKKRKSPAVLLRSESHPRDQGPRAIKMKERGRRNQNGGLGKN